MGKEIDALKDRFEKARLYFVTAEPPSGLGGYPAMVEAACRGGTDIVQFREKTLGWKQRYELGVALRKICAAHGVLFVVNDATDLALSVQADGVHLGQDDLPLAVARELIHRSGRTDFLVGKSTHSLDQAKAARDEGADYIGIGPVFATPTKPTCEPVGLELVRSVTSQVKTPHVAIGGINADNVSQVIVAGARRVAVVRALSAAADPEAEAKKLKSIFKTVEALRE